MQMDVIAYNASISSCEGQWQHANAFLREMQDPFSVRLSPADASYSLHSSKGAVQGGVRGTLGV